MWFVIFSTKVQFEIREMKYNLPIAMDHAQVIVKWMGDLPGSFPVSV